MAFTNEELSTLSQLLDSKLQPIQEDVRELKDDVQVLKDDAQVLKDDVQRIKLQNENEILPRLQNIEACYTSTYNVYKERASHIGEMQEDIDIMKKVIAEHSRKLQALGC